MPIRITAQVGGRAWSVAVSRRAGGHTVAFEGTDRVAEVGEGALRSVIIDGRSYEACVVRVARPGGDGRDEPIYDVTIGGRLHAVRIADPARAGSGLTAAVPTDGPAEIRAVMPGKVVQVLVAPGQEVRAGEGLVVVEAMKMENEITAPRPGKVAAVSARQGEPVESGALLVTLA